MVLPRGDGGILDVRKRPIQPGMGYYDAVDMMELDSRVCSRARLARDARFDGKFFIAVLTTRIYCRPICRSRTSKEGNVRYFPTAAAAAEAGFRPCLRCRPECSPGTAAWAGTQNTVSRALRLIGETGLSDGGVKHLAERLGMGERHLRRLFLKHAGATPTAVAKTRRLQFAKRLLDETRLPMGEVALAAGFGTVRRFNAAIRKVYSRTPTQIRRLAPKSSPHVGKEYVFRLNFRGPYNWELTQRFLERGCIPGVEEIEGGIYRRSIFLRGKGGQIEVGFDGENQALSLAIEFPDPGCLFFIIERVRRMFDLDADWSVIAKALRGDRELAPLVEKNPGLRVPGCWNGFELTTQVILGQGLSEEEARKLAGRFVRNYGKRFADMGSITHFFPEPDALCDAELMKLGIKKAKAEAIQSLARRVREGKTKFEGVLDCEAFVNRLREIPGIDSAVGAYVAMRALRDPDAFPAELLLLRTGVVSASAALEHRSESWRPWRAYAAMLLWQDSTKSQQASVAERERYSQKSSGAVPTFGKQGYRKQAFRKQAQAGAA
jgi:AraC family transcriptional regulator, regulatory protein of adaptative response / DNA-3-methyladenine glycosylase II